MFATHERTRIHRFAGIKSAQMASNEIRIIGGRFKGRKLRFPATTELRPTLGRVRETLFNWLAGEIKGARCLDLFAGSGALGFEALSRGAAEVTFVERNRKAATAIKSNIALVGSANASVFCTDARRFLARDASAWDIVFFDPPFTATDTLDLLADLINESRLKADGCVYVERPLREALPLPCRVRKESKSADCRFGLLARD
jgi:16S rRNA (guanine966-N2)-methyltransferase